MADKFPLQVTNATLASGDNTVVASAAGQAIKVYQLLVAAGANADTVTLKFTLAGTAQTAVIVVPVNTTTPLPYTGAAWANCDAGTAFVANSTTTTTKLTAYYTKGA
jgi:hypothetical protein